MNKTSGINTFLCVISYLLMTVIASCSKGVQERTIVYSNDFEANNLTGITGGVTTFFNQGRVIGRYNNSGFKLALDDLPDHDLIEVSFDLNIHDSWDGNHGIIDGPDVWKLDMDGSNFITTTFSNRPCRGNQFCPPQSYPSGFLNSNHNPKTGASRTDLPGVCSWAGVANGTSVYRIVKTMEHKESTFSLECFDLLRQPNAKDPLCDESWSVDNIMIRTIKLK